MEKSSTISPPMVPNISIEAAFAVNILYSFTQKAEYTYFRDHKGEKEDKKWSLYVARRYYSK